MVTVGFEQARGLREKHEKGGGFEVSASKTIAVSIGTVFKAFKNVRNRNRWLDLPDSDTAFDIRKATTDKSLRITWVDGMTSLDVNFYNKGKAKTQVVMQHTKLKNKTQAERMKADWRAQLNSLKVVLEK